jgi:acetyltransferase-like isoleucine patch superfamily enzyme
MKPWRVIRGAPLFVWRILESLVRSNNSRAGAELRRWMNRTSCHIDTHVFITAPKNFTSGEGCALYHGTYVLNGGGSVSLGERSHLGAFCFVNAERGAVRIGDGVAIGPGTKLIAYSNHYRAGTPIVDERLTADIAIGNNVFIGANCTLLPGCVVGDNVVIGAGSVVRGELAANGVYAGVPCKLVRSGWNDPPSEVRSAPQS